MLTKELAGREPVKGSHGKAIAAILVGSELPTKIGEREEGMGVVKTFLVFTVATLYFAVMPWRVRPDELVTNAFACQLAWNSVGISRLLLEKRLVNSKPLSV